MPPGDPRRKLRGRVVFQDHNVKTQGWEHVVLAGSWVDSPHLPAVLSVAADETSSSPREDNGLEVKDTCGEDVSGEKDKRLLTEDRLGLKVEAGSTEGEERPPRTSRQRKRRGRIDR